MKSFFRSLFKRRFIQHTDSFALTRTALWRSIADSIRLQQSMGKCVWLVSHFHETFSQCQTMLEEQGIDYHIETEPVTEAWLKDHGSDAGSLVHLILADLAKPLATNPDPEIEVSYRVAMMVAERHPYGPKDEQLLQFAASLPAMVEVGYFLAMEDELVKRLVPEQVVDLLKTMGLQEQDLISSAMVTKQMRRFIRRGAATCDVAGDAESASQWYAMQRD